LSVHGEKIDMVLRDAREFGLYEGLCIPIVNPRRSAVLASFNGRHVDTSLHARIAMYAVSVFTLERLVELNVPFAAGKSPLSRREAECLAWVAKGKSDWDIGEILGISEKTVHWHIEGAKRRLGVATRMQAVVGAIRTGAIRV
jgi:LuxR family transcriptional regulator, quorum-sensing system regulator BjaR1